MEMPPKEILRIIDANLNRASEGLRVLEEYARMALNDSDMTQRLKDMRHNLAVNDNGMQTRLVQAREAAGDVGSDMKAAGQDEQKDDAAIIVANSRRAQESLRVLEETAKTHDTGQNTDSYRKARFILYTIEKEVMAGIQRREKLNRLKGLYVIIDTGALGGRDHIKAAEQAIRGGARALQLRDKELKKKELIGVAEKISKLCRESGVLFIVNDYLDVALAADADGLHVGGEDLPPGTARRLLPGDKILGCSARTVEGAGEAMAQGADYLGTGGMYPTTSKAANDVIGTEGLKKIRKAVDATLVAIGGINKDNIREVIKAGADAIAVINAVTGAEDIEMAARELTDIIEGGSHG